jgi:hypothetical protein
MALYPSPFGHVDVPCVPPDDRRPGRPGERVRVVRRPRRGADA